ncbi:MAG: response regulator transcription factor [Gammaproteobacteria bacterium]|nr:MAG: response regulator transcription factor [Gammaproteobacteria bacterium]
MKQGPIQHKILVVDNEAFVVEELVEFLHNQGFSCLGCVSPQEALACFKENPEIDIVLSDFRMPQMNGVQLVEALRASASPGRVFEAIIFTGNAETQDVVAALRAEVADYYQKPLDLQQLLQGLSRVMTRIEKREAESKIKTLSQNLRMLSSSLSEICGASPSSENANGHGDENRAPASDGISIDDQLAGKLSPRQRDVAKLIARGLTNYRIACELGISENTVKIYVSQILRIFNLSNRTQLALMLEGGRSTQSLAG